MRLLLIVIALVGVSLAWAQWWMRCNLKWIRLRHDYLAQPNVLIVMGNVMGNEAAPWPLGWFGEPGVHEIEVLNSSIEHVETLFPEAEFLLIYEGHFEILFSPKTG